MNSTILRFNDNGILREIFSSAIRLKKENSTEFLYTAQGVRIALDDLVSLNGVSWA